jgi:glutamate racemase
MARIAVFDSGFGSLSVIKSIQKFTKSDIVYYADQKNFPYGNKTKSELGKIIKNTITKLEKIFAPDLIVMASNTPSILFPNLLSSKIVGVLPPIKQASKITKTKRIGVLVTHAAMKSALLSNHIKKSASGISVKKIDASKLIKLVENGKFITDKEFCRKTIRSVLGKSLADDNVDVITLSSTHLPFLLPILQKEFPHIKFLDPADDIARKIAMTAKKSKQTKLRIYTSKDPQIFQKHLRMLGIRSSVSLLP